MTSNQQRLTYLALLVATALMTIVAYHLLKREYVLYRDAENRFQSKHFGEAISLYEQAIQAGLQQPKVFLRLADSYTAERQFQQAAGMYNRYLTLEPKDYQARFKLARVLSYVGQYEESIVQYKQALQDSHAEPTNETAPSS